MPASSIKELADRVRMGEPGAVPQLRADLVSPLRRVARRALRPGTPVDFIVTRVRTAAREVSERLGRPVTGTEPVFLAHLVGYLSDDFLAGLLRDARSVREEPVTLCA